MDNLSDLIVKTAGSPLFVFVIGALNCAFIFRFAFSTVKSYRRHYKALAVFFVLLDAALSCLARMYAGSFYNIIVLPFVVVTAVMIAEIMIMTKDEAYVYYVLFTMLLVNYLSIYCVVAFVSHAFAPYAGHLNIYMSFTIIVSIIIYGAMSIGINFLKEVTYEYIHDRKRSSLLAVYLTSGNFILILSLVLSEPFLTKSPGSSLSEKVIYMDSALKTVFLLGTVYCIYIMYRDQDSYQDNKQLENELYKAKLYRINSQRELIISYSVNMRNAEMKDGRHFFKDELWDGTGGNYFKMLGRFAERCVHPNDRGKMAGQEAPVLANEALKSTPSFKHRLRISPKNLIRYINLNPSKMVDLESTDKEWVWSEVNVSLIRDHISGEIISYITIIDIDKRLEEENAIERQIKADPATGFYDAVSFADAVQAHMSREEAPSSLFFIDMSPSGTDAHEQGKKGGNDPDHLSADNRISDLKHLFRGDDIFGVTGGGLIEIYAPHMIDTGLIIEKAGQIISSLRNAGSETDSGASVSIGVALYPQDGGDFNKLRGSAESALYQSRIAGGNMYRFYERHMEEQ